jgi:hypothetical protein
MSGSYSARFMERALVRLAKAFGYKVLAVHAARGKRPVKRRCAAR